MLKPATDVVACPACGKKKGLERQISSFLSTTPGKHKAPPAPHPEYPDGYLGKHHDD